MVLHQNPSPLPLSSYINNCCLSLHCTSQFSKHIILFLSSPGLHQNYFIKMPASTIDWDAGNKSDLVSIGTHKLYLSVSGSNRKPGEPIILLMQGLGSTIGLWVAVKRQVTPFVRWLNYDRSGSGRSEDLVEKPEAISATGLETLLTNAGIEGPFIVLCHSWRGITSRVFFHLRLKDDVGIVFVDANIEKNLGAGKWPLPYFEAVKANVDYMTATGLAVNSVLSREEVGIVMKLLAEPREQATTAAEQRDTRVILRFLP
jgi:hypothetical protein